MIFLILPYNYYLVNTTAMHNVLMAISLIAVFSFCIIRDIKIEKGYTSDLRNRVIGARLQLDGKPPYFYKWKPRDGLRYYDPEQKDTTYANGITASPFFHHLLFPIADLPQRKISEIWLVVEYLMLIACLVFAFLLAQTTTQRWLCTITITCFLFTEGWGSLVMKGQMYILIPFCCFVFYFCINKRNKIFSILLAGAISGVLVLSRPTVILFFLPFIYMGWFRKYNPKQLTAFFLPACILLGYSIFNKKERSYWIEYYYSINAQMKFHQADSNQHSGLYKPVEYSKWEGLDYDLIKGKMPETHWEVDNIPAIIRNIFHITIPIYILHFILSATILALLFIFFKQHKPEQNIDVRILAIFGFCLYMITDFLSPIMRGEYYKVQWLFPLLLISAYYNNKLKVAYTIILSGLLLNIFFIAFIPMRHSVGEFMIFLALLWVCFTDRSKIFS
ncbi:MAG: DUF2029 domain-containing protein [Bacteroidetes bacterium]|nr:DUF2029 domain-containing protein [Bacteroidota bacterium]